MKKDNIRDYATEAFRFYAACGRLSASELENKVREEIYKQTKKEFMRSGKGGYSDATAYAVMAAETAVLEMAAEIRDILAVEKTLQCLDKYQRQAVELVYFTEPERDIRKGEISERVHRAELKIPASERNIYNWLKKARKIFAEERGLRISDKVL